MTGKTYRSITIEAFAAAISAAFGRTFASAHDFMTACDGAAVAWTAIDDWEALTDAELYARLVSSRKPAGRLWAVTEASYFDDRGAFAMDSTAIGDFIEGHPARFGACAFNGDLILFSPDEQCAWVFHHEGAFALIAWASSPWR